MVVYPSPTPRLLPPLLALAQRPGAPAPLLQVRLLLVFLPLPVVSTYLLLLLLACCFYLPAASTSHLLLLFLNY